MLIQFWRFLRSIYATVAMVIITAISCLLIIFGSLVLPDMRRYANWVLVTWSRLCCRALGLRIKVSGLEKLPSEGCLFLINHTSLTDIVIFHSAITKPARFGAKAELFKIPLFGWSMKRMGALKINRGERAKVLRLYQESVTRVHSGHSFVLAAEGGRIDHPGVGEKFKSGPFIFAISGQFPIVPVVLKGAHEVLPKGRYLPNPKYLDSEVQVIVLDPVPTKGVSIDDRLTLKKSIQTRMTNAFNEG